MQCQIPSPYSTTSGKDCCRARAMFCPWMYPALVTTTAPDAPPPERTLPTSDSERPSV